jgi:hypothetical protein
MHKGIWLAAVLSLAAMPALADLDPTPQELAGVEASLFERGYRGWERIELKDEGEWEVDRAMAADGVTYDLRLDYETLEITRKNRNLIQWKWNNLIERPWNTLVERPVNSLVEWSWGD